MAKTMKPWWMLGSVVTAGVLLVGCGSSDGGDSGDDDAAAASAEELLDGQDPEAEGEFADIIAQGLDGDEVVECVGEDPGASTIAHIDGDDRIHFETTMDDLTASTLIDGDDVHQWSEGATEGLTAKGDLADQISQGIVMQLGQAGAVFDECSVYDGSDDVFDKPSSVEFSSVSSQAETLAWFAQRYKDGDGEQMLQEQAMGVPAQRADLLMSIAPLLSLDDDELAEFAEFDDEEMAEYLATLGGDDPAEQEALVDQAFDELEPEHRAELEEYLASMQAGGMGGMGGMDGGMDGMPLPGN